MQSSCQLHPQLPLQMLSLDLASACSCSALAVRFLGQGACFFTLDRGGSKLKQETV